MPSTSSASGVQARILNYRPKARALLGLAVLAGFLAAAAVVAFAFVLSLIIARVFIDDRTLEDVAPLTLALVALAGIRATCLFASEVLAQRAANEVKSELTEDLLAHISRLGPAYTRRERTGELVHTIGQGVEDLDAFLASYQPARFLAILVPAFVALVVLSIDPWTVIILIVTGPFLVVFLALIGSRTKEMTERRFTELSWMSASFLDMLQGLPTLKMFGRSREQVENIRRISARYSNTTMDVLRTAFETSLVLELSASLATALVAVEISLRLLAGDVAFDRALAVLIITPEFFFPLRRLAAEYHAGASGRAAAERVFAILDTPVTRRTSIPTQTALHVHPGELRLESVGFSYDQARGPALTDVSVSIPAGSVTALVGASGSGKSTVANLLLRFIEPDSGEIYVDGKRLLEVEGAEWRSQVAWVPQHPHLFSGTVTENIRLARPSATGDEVTSAARAARAHDFIARLPDGYNTEIGERGARLSGGEQQRLAIARAFLKDAPLLILDEATSHLDAENESLIRDALERLMRGRTVLVIAHRMELARRSHRVVVMQQGRVVRSGPPDLLLDGHSAGPHESPSFEHGGGP